MYEGLAAANLSDLEKAVVAERLMQAPRRIVNGEAVAPGPTTLTELARRFGIKPDEVRRVESALVERLRTLIRF